MHSLKQGWFSEINQQWPGQAMSLEVDEVLFDEKSPYQHVQVFKSKTWGNVLILDDVIQLTERDESSYQEMITHLPMFSHSNPENVLIVGGGDGGVIREVVKHKSVKHITICEIDKMVIEQAKKYFPSMAPAWEDPRVNLVVDDASKFMETKEAEGKFDVIICDSSDPVGPAAALFESPFFKAMNKALKPGGRISTQAESMWLHGSLIKKLLSDSRKIFAGAEYASTQIPTYPCGQIGFLMLCKASDAAPARASRSKRKAAEPTYSCKKPVRTVPKDMKLNYYTSELHSASFVLPAFLTRIIESANSEESEKTEETAKTEAEADKQ